MGRSGRARHSRLWVALPAAMAINGFLLAGLTLFDPAPPAMEDSALVVTLERTEARRAASPRQRPPEPGYASGSMEPESEKALMTAAVVERPSVSLPSLDVEPAWLLGDGAYLRPETAGPARRAWDAADQRRYQRACVGLSSEHMTPEEKDRCYDGWGGARHADETRIGPREATARNYAPGPAVRPPPGMAREVRRQERCRSYRKRVLPGADAVAAPSLRDGGCF